MKFKKIMSKEVPVPSVMPIDRDAWVDEISLSNFINSYYQYRDIRQCGNINTILLIGVGQGLDAKVLKWRNYEVKTMDIDELLNPDIVGSVHDLSSFDDSCFDAVIVSHVLEHLAEPYLDTCLSELSRVGKYVLIYLPIAGRHFQLRMKMDFKGIDLSLYFDLLNYLKRPDGITPSFSMGQHYWEVGMRGFKEKDIVRKISKYFHLISIYRNQDWNSSLNFILKSRKWH